MLFVFLWLAEKSFSRFIHVAANGIISFFLMVESCSCVCVYVDTY